MKTRSYRTQVRDRAKRAFKETAIALNTATQETITIPRYWAGFEGKVTYRQNGEVVVGAFRDIFDLGNLATSQSLDFEEGRASITWDGLGKTPVLQVFYGFRTPNSFIPGRNWIEETLDNVNLAQMFCDNFS